MEVRIALMDWLRRFMMGRYGMDPLSGALFVLYLILWIVERIFGLWWMAFLTGLIILLILYRTLSRNLERRRRENQAFLRFWSPIAAWWRNRDIRLQGWRQKRDLLRSRRAEEKRYRYFQCGHCGQKLRVPKGKGKVKVRCPSCGNEFLGQT